MAYQKYISRRGPMNADALVGCAMRMERRFTRRDLRRYLRRLISKYMSGDIAPPRFRRELETIQRIFFGGEG